MNAIEALEHLAGEPFADLMPDGVGGFLIERGGLTIHAEPSGDEVLLKAIVPEAEGRTNPALLRDLLKATCTGAETGAASFALIPDEGVALMQMMQVAGLSAEQVKEQAGEFLGVGLYWRQKLGGDIDLPA